MYLFGKSQSKAVTGDRTIFSNFRLILGLTTTCLPALLDSRDSDTLLCRRMWMEHGR